MQVRKYLDSEFVGAVLKFNKHGGLMMKGVFPHPSSPQTHTLRGKLLPTRFPTSVGNLSSSKLVRNVVYYRKSYIFWRGEINNSGLHRHFK
jgi:hypothetical protein